MLKQYVEELLSLEPSAWERAAYIHEPQAKHLSAEQKHSLLIQAQACGKQTAADLREKYGSCSIEQLIGFCGGCIHEQYDPPDPYYSLFACFEKPNRITVNMASVAKSEQLMKDYQLEPLIGKISIRDLLLSHELYHLLESRKGKASFIQQRHACVAHLGRFRLMRKVDCLEEIAAMALATELLQLSCSPYIFNVLMLYAFYPQQAAKMAADYTRNEEQE